MSDDKRYRPATLAVRAGQQRGPEGEHAEALFLTSSYVFDSASEAAARFGGDKPGNIYSRFTNPTVRNFEQRLAALEGGQSCVATASGMSAILAVMMGLLEAGDHVVSSRGLFGSTTVLFEKILSRFGLQFTFIDGDDLDQWHHSCRQNTKLFFLETPSNPLTNLVDIAAVAAVARERNVILVVDNCFCTPALQQPLSLGADVVVHSATKFLDGQGRCMGGAVVGDAELVGEKVYGFLRTAGPTMSAFNAWVFLKGLETLDLRMRAHCENALNLAAWLQRHPAVEKVHYPGLEDHPQHQLAKSQQKAFGAIVAFEVNGGREQAWHVIDRTRLLSITANLGDAKTTITHPATTTHGRLSDEARAAAGIGENLIRVAVGLEDVQDIIEDLETGLNGLN